MNRIEMKERASVHRQRALAHARKGSEWEVMGEAGKGARDAHYAAAALNHKLAERLERMR